MISVETRARRLMARTTSVYTVHAALPTSVHAEVTLGELGSLMPPLSLALTKRLTIPYSTDTHDIIRMGSNGVLGIM